MVSSPEVEKLESYLKGRNPDLVITRFPQKAKVRFLDLAHEDFSGDYGMTLKFLLDFHDGIILNGNERVLEEIDGIKNRLSKLEEEPKKEIKRFAPRME